MLKKIALIFSILITGLTLNSCSNDTQYKDQSYWYQSGRTVSEEKPDVFYIVSTVVYSSYDEDGNQTIFANLNSADKALMDEEINDIATNMFTEEFNFFAPYYHEVTMSKAMEVDSDTQAEYVAKASKEINEAFDYYYKYLNNGRPFIIAGYSQGSVMAKKLVKHLNKRQLKNMAACYVMGGPITEEDLENKNIKVATSEDDLHTIISYNSVASLDGIYDFLTGSNINCINPVNWKTDDTPATFEYKGTQVTVHIDTDNKVLIVEGLNPDDYYNPAWPFPYGNYHNDEIHFYASFIRDNALLRINKLIDSK